MKPTSGTFRMPADLHKRAVAQANTEKLIDPGYSLNSLICKAVAEYLQRRAEQK